MAASKSLGLYWRAYGGWPAFVRSPYLWTAITFTSITFPVWLELDDKGTRVWSQLPLGIVPNLLGFSMGGMAIMLAFSGSKVMKILSETGSDNSFYIRMVAAFFHFIMAQTAALFLRLFCRAYSWAPFSFIGYSTMCYAILIAIATASQIFNASRIVNLADSLETTSGAGGETDQGPG